MDVAKSLHQLASAFTVDAQVTQLRSLVTTLKRATEITAKQRLLLDAAVDEAVFLVKWNQNRLTELLERMRTLDFLKDSAHATTGGIIVLSFTLVLTLISNYLY